MGLIGKKKIIQLQSLKKIHVNEERTKVKLKVKKIKKKVSKNIKRV